jgi:hypothetical protein
MAKYLSGRVKRTPQDKLSEDRFKYLGLDQAEPNIGDPPSISGSPSIPAGTRFQIVSLLSHPGERFWVPIEGGLIPGSISVFDEGTLVGTLSSITQLNFIGAGVSAQAVPLGVAATIRVSPPGDPGDIQYVGADYEFTGENAFSYNQISNVLSVDGGLNVGINGALLKVNTGIGSVGIGTINPTQKLDVNGNVRVRGGFYDSNNSRGNPADILVSGGNADTITWINQSAAVTGAGGTISQVQYHGASGLTAGATEFVYISSNGRVGIGSTQPTVRLDVIGDVNIAGDVDITKQLETQTLEVIGVSTFQGIVTCTSNVYFASNAHFGDSDVLNFGHQNDLKLYHSGSDSFIHESGVGQLNISGSVVEIGGNTSNSDKGFQYTSGGAAKLYFNNDQKLITTLTGVDITGTLDADFLDITGVSTFRNQVDILNNLYVSGITTVGNIKLDTNTISSNTGNLILDSTAGTLQVNDVLYVNDATQSNSKDSGSVIVEGGVGIEKNLNVGGHFKVTGVSTFVGVGTFLGDLWVGNNLNVAGDLTYDEISGRNINITGITTVNFLNALGVTTFRDDVHFDSAHDIWFDQSESAFEFDTDAKITFGDVGELAIYHSSTGTQSHIKDTSGDLFIQSNNIHLESQAGVDLANFASGGSVILYYDGNPRLTTLTQGIEIEGEMDSDTADVHGQTTTQLLLATGVTTCRGDVDIGNAVSDILTITSRVDSHIVPSADYTYDLGQTTGSNLRWRNVSAQTFNGAFQGNATTATRLLNARNFSINGGTAAGDVFSAAVSFDGTANVVLDGALRSSGVSAGTYGNATNVGQFAVNSQGVITSASNVAINFTQATVLRSQQVMSVGITTNASHHLTFVRGNNNSAEYEHLYTNDGVYFNPNHDNANTGKLYLEDLQVSGDTTFGDTVTADTVNFTNSRINSHFIPAADSTYDIGDGTTPLRWRKIYADEFDGQFTGTADNANKIKTEAKDTSTSTFYLTFVDSNNNPGAYESVYTDSTFQYVPTSNRLTLGQIKPGSIVDSSNSTGTSTHIPVANGSGGWSWQANAGGSANTIQVTTNNSSTTHYLTFVAGNSTGTKSLLQDSNSLTYVTNDNKLTVEKARISHLYDSANSDGSSNQVPISNGTTWSWGNISSTGGLNNIQVQQTGYSCTNPITVSTPSTGTKRINIAYASNAYGRRFIQSSNPSGPCNGDIWYDTSSSGSLKIYNGSSWEEIIGSGGTAPDAEKVETRAISGNQWYYPTFVDSNNSSATAEYVYTDAGLRYNPANNDIDIRRWLNVNSQNTSGVGIKLSNKGDIVDMGDNTCAFRFGAGVTVYSASQGGSWRIKLANNGDGQFQGNVTAYFSDQRLKDVIGKIDNPISKVLNLRGVYYKENEKAKELGYDCDDVQVGVIAQDVQKVLPEAIKPAPGHEEYMTVQYEKIVPLLIEAMKEQQGTIDDLKSRLEKLEGK